MIEIKRKHILMVRQNIINKQLENKKFLENEKIILYKELYGEVFIKKFKRNLFELSNLLYLYYYKYKIKKFL